MSYSMVSRRDHSKATHVNKLPPFNITLISLSPQTALLLSLSLRKQGCLLILGSPGYLLLDTHTVGAEELHNHSSLCQWQLLLLLQSKLSRGKLCGTWAIARIASVTVQNGSYMRDS